MERILLVCGSLQPTSANRAVLVVVAACLADAEVAWFDRIGELPAFDAGRVDEDTDAVGAWRRAVADASLVVVAVPEYAGGMAGATKNALDWLVGNGELYRKPVVVVSAGTSGGVHARRQAAQTVTWQGAYVVAELGVAAPRTKFDTDGRLHDAATAAAIGELCEQIRAASSLTADGLVERATAVVARLGVDVAHVSPA